MGRALLIGITGLAIAVRVLVSNVDQVARYGVADGVIPHKWVATANAGGGMPHVSRRDPIQRDGWRLVSPEKRVDSASAPIIHTIADSAMTDRAGICTSSDAERCSYPY